MENTRFLKLVIVALLLINIGVLSYLWISRQGQPVQGPPPRQDVFAYLCKELQLNENQTRQYEELRDEHHAAVENIQHHGGKLRERMFDLLHSSPVDSSAVKSISDSIALTQEQIELVTFYHFRKVRTILKPEQQKHFDEIIQGTLRMMGRQGPPPQSR